MFRVVVRSAHATAYSREKFAVTPIEYAESPSRLGDNVWRVHCVKRGTHGTKRFAVSGTGTGVER